jgi:penicillin-binding protein 1A
LRVRRIRKLRLLAVLWVFGLLGVCMFTFGLVTSIRSQLPQLDPANRSQQQNGVVYAADGRSVLMVLRGDQSRTIVPDEEISPWMKYAIVAIEDRRFWEHRGVDVRGIMRAAWQDITKGRVVEGGSTITQQFVKQAFTSDQRTIARKLKEAAFAWQLEQKWTKPRILTAYLNTIFFGNQAYGVEQASRIYFGHSSQEMTVAEAALLAGIPKDPNLYDPVRNLEDTRARRREVLKAMLGQSLIDAAQFRQADATPLPTARDLHLPATQGQAPYFANYVREQLLASPELGRKVYGGGLRVTTTIDLRMQKLARDAVQKWLPSPDGPQAALVALDPRTGAVLAMVGGRNYHDSQFNLATQQNRQVGSSFKPIVLATALHAGIAPQTTLVSRETMINAGGRLWPVHNYEGEYMGPIDLTTAMVHSDNSVFAQLTALVGPANVATMAKRLGVTGKLNGYFSIGLGGEPVSPLEMARAYSTFANGGKRIDGALMRDRPRVIATVKEGSKELLNAPVERPVLSASEAATIDQILQGVVQSGTGKAAAIPSFPIAGKTGTTENYGDAWFVGYTPHLVVAVWVGYPTKLIPMLTEFQGRSVTGGSFPALIFKSFMQSAIAYKQLQPESFPYPQSLYVAPRTVVQRNGKLELDNGYCRGATSVAFYGSTAPAKTADCKPNEVEVPRVIGRTLADARAQLEAQPLTPSIVYKPARPRQRLGVVLGQMPKGGTLSSYDKVTIVLAKPLHGVVPRLVGLPLAQAQARLAKRKLQSEVTGGTRGRVVRQAPAAGLAAAPGMTITLAVTGG